MTRRRTKLPLAPRVIAVGCVLLWLAGISACNLEALFGCPSHGSEAAAHEDHEYPQDRHVTDTHHAHDSGASHLHDAEAHHLQDAEGDSHDSHKHESREGSCCSTLMAVVLPANAIIFNKQAFHPTPSFCVLLQTHATSLASRAILRPASPSHTTGSSRQRCVLVWRIAASLRPPQSDLNAA